MKKIFLLMTVMFIAFAFGLQGVASPDGEVGDAVPAWENPGIFNDSDILEVDIMEVETQHGDQVIIYFYGAHDPASVIDNHKGMIDIDSYEITENDKSNISAPTTRNLSGNLEPGLVRLE